MPTLPIFAVLKPLEKISVYTPLGIRFWDFVSDSAVVDGLQVIARPPGMPHLTRRAFQTSSGVYAFQNLPGLRGLEAPDPDLPAGLHPIMSSPPETARFIVEVYDQLSRFLPATFQVELPYRGVYPTRPPGGILDPALPGFFLFSAPSRAALSNAGVVRAQLTEPGSTGRLHPAHFAVLQVQLNGGPVWSGIADETGSAAVFFPYPPFTKVVGALSPPPVPPEARLQAWDLTVRVRYQAGSQRKLDGFARLPDLSSILTQPVAKIWTSRGGSKQTEIFTQLVFGQPLMLRTTGVPELWIEA